MKTQEVKMVGTNFISHAEINSSKGILITSLERAIENKKNGKNLYKTLTKPRSIGKKQRSECTDCDEKYDNSIHYVLNAQDGFFTNA